ncbi:hypothetical protein B0T18DRAFT_432823 [Schizothecium vesticola]|uniref:Rhodopsin domain-containing protein n=1 Tax=Schizothecium vesticola TaxID=314040 RepID=A0AA40EIF8_9PEZI|nr:hypothetical protein B0T18DRAFT_432823 [Schizothecium vesticola]
MSADAIPTAPTGPDGGGGFDAPGLNFTGPPAAFFIVGPREAKLCQVYVAATTVLVALSLLTYGARIYTRIKPGWKNLGLDDYFITAGVILSLIDWGLITPSMYPTEGLQVATERATVTAAYSWIAIGVWGLAMTCIKLSICFTLLRIQQQLAWRLFIYAIMAIQVVYGVGNLVFNLTACRPLQASWDFALALSLPGACLETKYMAAASNTGSAINITTDVLLSLAPAVFLRKLNRPLRERLFICFLMGLGLFATLSSILKTVEVQKFYDPSTPITDFFPIGITISTWTVLEQMSGILAACIPANKGVLQQCLGKVGVSLHESRSRPGRSGYIKDGPGFSGMGGTTLTSQMGSRFERAGKEDLMDEEERYLELAERRNVATPRSGSAVSAASLREGDLRLPTQGV